MLARPENQDGARLHHVATNQLWLVYLGKRHHITCTSVHDALFKPFAEVRKVPELSDIRPGSDLIFGTRLIRPQNRIDIYLQAVHVDGVVLHHIPSADVFDKYGFDFSLCRNIPDVLFSKMKKGKALR